MGKFAAEGPVMVLSAASGAGHMRAADALVSAFTTRNIAAEHIEVLKYTNAVFKKVYSDLYLELVNKNPEVLRWVYNSMDRPWKFQKRRLALDLLNTGPLVKLLKRATPPVAICTHFLPAEILLHLKRKRLLDLPVGVVVTDFDAHAMWLFRGVDWYFVACEETKVYLEKQGIPAETVHVTGIPVDPVFAVEISRRDARLRQGLDPDLTTILVSVGGFGVGPMENIIRAIDELEHPVQIVVICGKNARLKENMEKVRTRHPVKVVGFTTEMDSYMAASEFLVGKAGGLTSSEALARGLVLVIVNPVPGQEERNCDHFLEEGAAVRCNNLPTLAYKIDDILGNKARLRRMQASARRIGRPRAASEIVSIVLGEKGNR
jgi:processive 1,2-diacylglycerol beta-glucosyltransferase